MHFEKHMFIALTLCTFLMLLNIVAVSTGIADAIYAPVSEWLATLL